MSLNMSDHKGFGGFPISVIKKTVLRGLNCARYGIIQSSFFHQMYDEPIRNGILAFSECFDRDFLTITGNITPKGRMIATAFLTKKTKLNVAKKVMEEFLNRIREYNEKDTSLYISDVWLFGSVLREEETVNDLDMAISIKKRNPDEYLHHIIEDKNNLLKFICGKKRSPLLRGLSTELYELIELHVPCRQLYQYGTDDFCRDILPHHPASVKQSDNIRQTFTTSDMILNDIKPFHAGIVTDEEHNIIIDSDDPESEQVMNPIYILTSQDDCDYIGFRNVKDIPDGRNICILLSKNKKNCVYLYRDIIRNNNKWTYKVSVTHDLTLKQMEYFHNAINFIMSIDIERMERHQIETGITQIVIKTDKDIKKIGTYIL